MSENNCKCKEESVEIKVWREDPRSEMPVIAYEGTSACFDLINIEDVVIPAHGTNFVKNGLRFIIPNGWYVEFATRSSHGITNDLKCHCGIIDSGFMGKLSVKMYNLGNSDVLIPAGKGAVQCKVHKVRPILFTEIDSDEFNNTETVRGQNGFGSSDKK